MTPTKRYPAGPVTPHGAHHILRNRIPMTALRSYDDLIVFHLQGGLAIPDRTMPERVELKGLKGLMPPWTTIDQKGATQDGTTFIDALYDPIEVDMDVVCHGRSPEYCRRVSNDLIASIDAKKTSELSWFTHEMGRWWANVRWFKTPANEDTGGSRKREPKSLRLRADSGFWQSYPDVAAFEFYYDGVVVDEFDTDTSSGMGSDYSIAYTGSGGGYMRIHNGMLEWVDDPDHPILTDGRTGIFRYNAETFNTDTQVAETTLGTFPEWSFPDPATNILGLRMPSSGTVGATGVFAEFGAGVSEIYYKIAGVKTSLRSRPLVIPPLPNEKWRLIAGYDGNPYLYKLTRDYGIGLTIEVMSVIDAGGASPTGVLHRNGGGGMHAGASIISQATPARMHRFVAGDQDTIANTSQSTFLLRRNAGDQDMWDNITCVGPGMFYIWDGPNAGPNDYVALGPLLPGQIAQVRTDPRKYGVKDLTLTPATPAQEAAHASALEQILSFITFNSVTHGLDVLQSVSGLFGGGSAPVPPQGNLYALLNGRFSQPIPAKSPGRPIDNHYVRVQIDNGNADSQIIMSGTPYRRFPY